MPTPLREKDGNVAFDPKTNPLRETDRNVAIDPKTKQPPRGGGNQKPYLRRQGEGRAEPLLLLPAEQDVSPETRLAD